MIIRKLIELVQNGQHLLNINENCIPKQEVVDHQKCHVKFPIL